VLRCFKEGRTYTRKKERKKERKTRAQSNSFCLSGCWRRRPVGSSVLGGCVYVQGSRKSPVWCVTPHSLVFVLLNWSKCIPFVWKRQGAGQSQAALNRPNILSWLCFSFSIKGGETWIVAAMVISDTILVFSHLVQSQALIVLICVSHEL